VFLAGDAAHTIPPIGAFGMSTGVADAQNLAWKLAMVLRGQASRGLLDSYQAERMPVARFTRDQALRRFEHLELHWKSSTEQRAEARIADPLVTSLGVQYAQGAVIDARAEAPSWDDVERNLDGTPGTRVPHAWARRSGERVSTLDVVAPGFVLLAGPEGGAWCAAAEAVSARRGVPVRAYRVGPGGDLDEPDGAVWAETAGLAPDGALLVRPDAFVAWRSPTAVDDPQATLAGVLDRLLDGGDRSPG
jgi:putative polyketide hydroxylase